MSASQSVATATTRIKTSGVVKFFNDMKGWGFLTFGNGETAFVHYSNIVDAEVKGKQQRKTLYEGQAVEFDLVKEQKGFAARNVVVTEF